ncbi:MAG TPA: [NiFe]-hydrogenase assembly chaperone HybE [Azonexus sp.]
MRLWTADPALELASAFTAIAETRMAGLPICNPALRVEALPFRRTGDGHWAGLLITPWALNLLCLPGRADRWPAVAAGGKHEWSFPSGSYEFIVADEASLGPYHLCSLFSPALEFASHEQARLTALAADQALVAAPLAPPAPAGRGRRAFLGLSG